MVENSINTKNMQVKKLQDINHKNNSITIGEK